LVEVALSSRDASREEPTLADEGALVKTPDQAQERAGLVSAPLLGDREEAHHPAWVGSASVELIGQEL
jgi:hypothetical protein